MNAFTQTDDLTEAAGSILNESKVYLVTDKYKQSHGKNPSGSGRWAFDFNRNCNNPFFISGDYKEAKKQATDKAKEAGQSYVYVCP